MTNPRAKFGAIALSVAGLLRVANAGAVAPCAAEKPAEPAFSFPISYTGEFLGNLAGGYRRGAVYEGLLSLGVQGDLEKTIGWKGASLLLTGIYPHGQSLTGLYVHDFNSVSNIDANDSVRLYEAWLQQELWDGKVSVRLGQLVADAEFCVSDNAALFVNGGFGAMALNSNSFSFPVFPVAAPGIRVRMKPTEAFSVQTAAFEGDAGNPAVDNKHGTTWRLNDDKGVLAIAEAACQVNGGKGDSGLHGVYKVGAFYHTADLADPNTGLRNHTGNFGAYFIADQQLWREIGSEDQGLGGFLLIGGAGADGNDLPFYCDAGFNYKGLAPGRDNDLAGIGLSYSSLKDTAGSSFTSHHETILEVTYRAGIRDWLSIQPDFQYIFTPGGDRTNAVVVGIRFNATFQ